MFEASQAAVIASAVAEQLPEIGPQLKELTFAVVLVSIVATSVLVPLVDVPGVRGVVGWWFGGYRRKCMCTTFRVLERLRSGKPASLEQPDSGRDSQAEAWCVYV